MLLVAAARRRRGVVDRAIALDADQLASVRAVGLHIARSIRSPEQPSWVSNSRQLAMCVACTAASSNELRRNWPAVTARHPSRSCWVSAPQSRY